MGVWNGRRDWLLCANYPGHEGEMTHVSGTGIVVDCRRFCRRWELVAAGGRRGATRFGISVWGMGGRRWSMRRTYEWLNKYKWHSRGGTSRVCDPTTIEHKPVLMHRFIVNPREGYVVDHINGNKHDNRRGNLRECTHGENRQNSRKSRGTSRFKGVFWNTRRGKWGAAISCEGKMIHLGSFTDEIEAAQAYDRAAVKYFGAFACLNFPQKIRIVDLSGTIHLHSHVRGRIRKASGLRPRASGKENGNRLRCL